MSRDPYARIAPWYDRLLEPANAPVRSIAYRMYEPDETMSVLDAGCGTGAGLERYVNAGCDCHGVDTSEAMLAQAHKRLGDTATLTLGSADDLAYDSGTFDLVLAGLFLHELSPTVRDRVISELARVTSAEGRMLITDFGTGDLTTKGHVVRSISMVAERIAGRDHKKNCKTFLATGGIPAAATRLGLEVENSRHVGGGNMAIYLLKKPKPKTEDRKAKTEKRRPKTEDRRPKTDG